MNWLFLALIAPIFWSFTNIFDKIILSKHKVDPRDYMIFGGLFWLFNLIFIPLADFEQISLLMIGIGLLVGILRVLSFLFYNKAMRTEEASRLSPLSNIGNIFILVLSAIFLKEVLTTNQLIAFFLILFGASFLGIKKTKGKFKLSPAIGFLTVNMIVYSLSVVLLKYAFGYITFWTAMVIIGIGEATVPIVFLMNKKHRDRFVGNIKSYSKIIFILMMLSNASALIGSLTSIKAFQLGPLAIVNVLGGLASVLVLIWATFLSKYFPKTLKERYNFKILLLKSFSISLMMMGLYFLSK